MTQPVLYKDLGQNRSYSEIWDMQENLLNENVQRKSASVAIENDHQLSATNNHLLFVEHNPVYTLGKAAIAAMSLYPMKKGMPEA